MITTTWMRSFLLDLTCVFRALRATPVFACVATCTLALGIAFNVIVFSLVDAVLLNPLPYPQSAKLVVIESQSPHRLQPLDITAPMVFFVKQEATAFEHVAASYPTEAGVNLTGMGRPKYVRVLRVSADFFRTLGADPILGRTFSQSEDRPEGAKVAVLSYSLWKNMLADRRDLGGPWRINGEPYTVIGVMQESFRSYPEADVWLPLQLSATDTDPGSNYRVVARIRNGVTVEEARAELEKLSEHAPFSQLQFDEHTTLVPESLATFESHTVRQQLMFLLSAGLVVLLITCANIAMLMLVRAVARSHEIGVRLALGSSRRRVFQLFFFEGATISVFGGLFGLIAAKELLPFLLLLAPPGFPQLTGVRIDWLVVEFALGVSAFTAALFGVPIAIRFSRLHLNNEVLRATNFRLTAGRAQTRAARIILVLQTASTLVLLSCAILFLRHLLVLHRIDPGFESRQAAVAQVTLVGRPYETAVATSEVLDRILKHLQASSFVENAAATSTLPLERGLNVPISAEDASVAIENAEYRSITADYFSVMKISLIAGRQFTTSDGPHAQPVAIVNEMLARKCWPQEPAIGHFITIANDLGPDFIDRRRLIVGVAANVHQSSLEQADRPTIFVPVAQVPDSIMAYTNQHFLTSIVIRTPKPDGISEQVRSAIESADLDLAVVSFQPLSQVVRNSTSRDRFHTFLTVIFGGFALLITTIGFYGLVSYQVALGARDLAVRMSFGANRRDAVILTVEQILRLVAITVVLGSTGSLFFMFPLAKLLYNQVGTLADLAAGIVALLFATLLASLIAAVKIVSIEPISVLRNE
jgi:putative ABC transport system permease protein